MNYYFPNRPYLIPKNDQRIIELSNNPDYDCELKKNGSRLVLINNDSLTFYNRQKEIMKYNPSNELLQELTSLDLPKNTQLDGELMHFKTKHLKHTIFFYDIYTLNGKQLYCELEERRNILKKMFNNRNFKNIFISHVYQDKFLDIFRSLNEEDEGIVIKNKHGKIQFNPYKSIDVTWQLKVRKNF